MEETEEIEEFDWFPSEEDFENAEDILYEERFYSLNRESLFRAGMYSILTAAEEYGDTKGTYNLLMEKGIDTPEKVRKMGKEELIDLIENGSNGKRITHYNQKAHRIYKFADGWSESDLPEKILEDVENKRKEISDLEDLRNEIVEEFTGFGPKVVSFFQLKCGYENAIPLDSWESRFLDEILDEDIKVPDYYEIGGHSKEEHSELEKKFLGVYKSLKMIIPT